MIESGEAIRLGDPQADSVKKYSSLRIRAGQTFGAEEVNESIEMLGDIFNVPVDGETFAIACVTNTTG